jgi:hypothetical protein
MNRIDIPCTDPRPDRREALALLAGGDLPAEEAARLESHAGACPACRELLAGLRESGAALALLAEEDLAAEPRALARVREGVRAGVAEIAAERRARAGRGAPPRWALAAVLLVALVVAGVWMRSGPRPVENPPAKQAVERAPGPASGRAPEAPEAGVPPAAAGAGPEAPDTGNPPADRIARTVPADRPAIPPVRDPEARRSGEAAGIDPVDPAAGAPSDAGPAGPGAEPQITIRIVSDDPDIVFYWLVEPEENPDEETVSS